MVDPTEVKIIQVAEAYDLRQRISLGIWTPKAKKY